MSARRRPYRLFEVTGIEVEYAVVDDRLQPRPLVAAAFGAMNGHPTSELKSGRAEFSHEFAAHQFEVRTADPQRDLLNSESILLTGVGRLGQVLRDRFGARLLPTGMHPFLHPRGAQLWPHARAGIFETYARLFPVWTHGFMNVQATHVNLPFGRTEEETVALHNAICCLMAYLPALAASSPVYEGRLGPCVDNRLAFIRTMQDRIPAVTGRVIPQYMESFRQYRRDVLGPIRDALRRRSWAWRLTPEWVNSRGAILRFHRRAIEIRVLDVQECVKADLAIAAFVRGALLWLTQAILAGELPLPTHAVLVRDYHRTVRSGRHANVMAPHLSPSRRPISARRALEMLWEKAGHALARDQRPRHDWRPYLRLVENRIERGNLSERVAAALRSRTRGNARQVRSAIREIYEELAQCLERNEPWDG